MNEQNQQTATEIDIQECVRCHQPWSMTRESYDWRKNRVSNDPEMQMPKLCNKCRNERTQPNCATSDKAAFQTQQEAETFEKRNREQNGYGPQRAYLCECEKWHLTSRETSFFPEAPVLARVDYQSAVIPKGLARGETRERVRELIARKLNADEIAKRLGVSIQTVYYHTKQIENENQPVSSPFKKALSSLSDIDLKRQQLQEQYDKQLTQLKTEEERIKREELLNIMPDGAGNYLVRKQRERMTFTTESFKELIDQALKQPALVAMLRSLGEGTVS